MPQKLSEQMRRAYTDPFGTEMDPRHLLLLGAKEIERLESEVLTLKDDARHHDETSKYWEAKTIALRERLKLCGY